MIERKSVLVTGGAGFLGSHLCDRLLEAGHDVNCLDNFFTGSKRNIEHLIGNPRFELVRHDVTFPLYVEVDEIYNVACPASPIHYQHISVQTTRTNVLGVAGARQTPQVPILQASTSEVYGDPSMHTQREDCWGNVNPVGPCSCYHEGNRCAETLLFDYWRQHHLDIKVARIFNTYGPRVKPNDGRVVSNFVNQAPRGEALTIYCDDCQTRSFCCVDDLIVGLIRLMASRSGFAGPVNLGNEGEFTIRNLAETIVEMVGSGSRIEFRPLPRGDSRRRRPDIAPARQELAWEPRVPLATG
jgi:UDP-glucuronate decarboxylase